MTDVPPGWAETSVGVIGRYLNGRGFKKSEWREAGRPIIRIQNLTGTSEKYNYFDGEADERHTVRRGDLLVSWAATLGVYKWSGDEAVLNQHIFKVESHIHAEFHRYLLQHALDDMYRQAHGSGMVHITKGKFDSTPILLPPLAEQERIVAAIEEHFSHLDAAETALRRAEPNLERLRRAAVDDLPSGALVPLGDLLAEKLRNGFSAKRSPDGTVRVLTLTAVTQSEFIEQNTKLISVPDEARVADLWLRRGDVLIQRSNTPELVGTAAMYRGPDAWAIFPDLLIRARPSAALNPEYLELVLQSTPTRRYLRESAQGIAGSMPKISQGIIESIKVPLPRLEEQGQIVTTASARSEAIRRLRTSLVDEVARTSSLRRSVLAAAFSGRLVPQDPDDEPASVLLDRSRSSTPTRLSTQSRRASA